MNISSFSHAGATLLLHRTRAFYRASLALKTAAVFAALSFIAAFVLYGALVRAVSN